MEKEPTNAEIPTVVPNAMTKNTREPSKPQWTGEDIAVAMLRAEGLVSHHLDSFNSFLARLPSLVQNNFRAEVRNEARWQREGMGVGE